jgi:hypothetical protein
MLFYHNIFVPLKYVPNLQLPLLKKEHLKMNIRKKPHKGFVGAFILLGSYILFQSPVQADLLKFMAFADEPKDNTYLTVYPEIQDLFESDNTLVLIVEPDGPPKQKYLVNVQIQNLNGKTVYNEQKDLELKRNKGKSYLHYLIVLDDEIKAKLSPGSIIIKFYIEGKPCQAKLLQYYKESIFNKNINNVVILPFYSSTDRFSDSGSKDEILATFSDVIRCEMERIAPVVIPPEAAASKFPTLKSKDCFEKPACRNELKNIFSDGIFITGDVNLPKSDSSLHGRDKDASFRLLIFNARTGENTQFRATNLIDPSDNEMDTMKALIKNILTHEGFQFHIRSLF